MKWQAKCTYLSVKLFLASVLVCVAAVPSRAGNSTLQELVGRANDQAAKLGEEFSDVKCPEHVAQEKVKADGKVELKEQSTYDYLVILTNAGGEISLDESRLAVHEQKQEEKNRISMLFSNGFAALFLVFHPYYSSGFEFTQVGEDTINGHKFNKVKFNNILCMLAL